MLKEYPELRSQNLRTKIYKETIQLITTHNEDRIHAILHFSTNILSFVILSGYSNLDNQELLILNSWVNISNTLTHGLTYQTPLMFWVTKLVSSWILLDSS
ncbi:hypothetical protein HN51_025675 [Arachis hypogaea]|uniref:Uncharacterized protein n=1 Tax=Arachis hypogaea TaxID=3818 RepID=A0A445CER6_ARAHY|nr:Chloroplast envelope membrane protein [Arachis hypogaea]RYR49415.1 hypothetical protein Ahy_A07g035904 [Arachis hypogaea]